MGREAKIQGPWLRNSMGWESIFSARHKRLMDKYRNNYPGLSSTDLKSMLTKLAKTGNYSSPVTDTGEVALDADPDSMSFTLKFIDGNTRDQQGDLSVVEGLDYFTRFYNNSVILSDHGKMCPWPIGVATSPDGECTVDINYADKIGTCRVHMFRDTQSDHGKYCRQLFLMVSAPTPLVRAGSYGFSILQSEDLPADYANGYPPGKLLLKTLLLEVSLTVLGAHPDTIAGKALSDGYWGNETLHPLLTKSLLGQEPEDCLPLSRKRKMEILQEQSRQIAELKQIVDELESNADYFDQV